MCGRCTMTGKMYPSKEVARGLPPSYMDASVDNNMRARRASLIKTALSHSEVPLSNPWNLKVRSHKDGKVSIRGS